MWWLLLVILILGTIQTARASVIFEDCGSAYELEAVHIAGCGARLPCYVTLGERTPVQLEFVAGFMSSKLDQNVSIQINFINVAAEVTPEPCVVGACPVRTDQPTSFTSVLTVPWDMGVNQRGDLVWRVYNERGLQVLCYSVRVQTQSPTQKLLKSLLHQALGRSLGLAAAVPRSHTVLTPSHVQRQTNSTAATPPDLLWNVLHQAISKFTELATAA